MTEQNVYVPLDLRGVQTLLCSCAQGSNSPDMSLTQDHTGGGSQLLKLRPVVYEFGSKK